MTVARTPFLAARRGERIGIVGPNGAGKTTLLRTIAGDLPALDGAITFGHNVQPAYLAQLRDAAIPGETVLDAILAVIPITPGEARGYLARFLFRGDDVFKEVRLLSGGERSRLELALLGILPSNLLLLDEPTNHLDIAAREAIEAFLAEAPATIVVVSHDRRLLETICERLWVVDDGLAVPFDDGYRAWRAAVGRAGPSRPRRRDAPTAARRRRGRSPSRAPERVGDAAAAPSAKGAVAVGGAPAEGPPEAVEGGLPAPARGPRRRAVAPRPPAAASWSSRSGPRRSRPTSSRCAGSPASSRTSSARSPRPRTPGSSSRSRRRDRRRRRAAHRDHRADRLRQVPGRPLARGAGRGRRSTPTTSPADVTAPGEPAHDAVARASSGAAVTAPDGTLDRAALARVVFADPDSAPASSRRSSIRRSGPGSWPPWRRADAAGAPAVVVEAIKLVEGGLASLCDEVWLVTCDAVSQRERDPCPWRRPPTTPIAGSPLRPGSPNASRRRATRVIDTSGDAAGTRERGRGPVPGRGQFVSLRMYDPR